MHVAYNTIGTQGLLNTPIQTFSIHAYYPKYLETTYRTKHDTNF